MHLELDEAEFVLLVVLDPAVVGAALHVHELPGLLGLHLDRHQWGVVSDVLVHLVPLALREKTIKLIKKCSFSAQNPFVRF